MPCLMSGFGIGGAAHAPSDLRKAFEDLVDRLNDATINRAAVQIDYRESRIGAVALCGLLWNCSDILPSLGRMLLADLGFEGGHTYADAARWLHRAYLR